MPTNSWSGIEETEPLDPSPRLEETAPVEDPAPDVPAPEPYRPPAPRIYKCYICAYDITDMITYSGNAPIHYWCAYMFLGRR